MNTRWKILIWIGVFLLLVSAVSFVSFRLQPENEVEAYKSMLRTKGEKLTVAEVRPPAVPIESNCVGFVESAFRLFGSGNDKIPSTMKMVAPGKALISWQQTDVRSSDFTNSWEEFETATSADEPIIEQLRQVLVLPQLDFQPDYSKGFLMLLPHLAPLKRCAQKLSAATMLDLHQGNTAAATTNISTMLALVRADQNEGVIISHLVRIAITAIASAATWDLLQATNLNDASLAALQKHWEQMEFFASAEKSFLMERAIMVATIEKLRGSHKEFTSVMSGIGATAGASTAFSPFDLAESLKFARLSVGEVMWRTSWSYNEELHLLQGHQVMLETLRKMQTNQCLKAEYDVMTTKMNSLGLTNAGEAFFRALKIPDFREEFDANFLSTTVLKTIRIETARRVVVTAIALKRFQVRHGCLPETLNDLMPDLLAVIPLDPADGKPLRYHPNVDGTYLLYCVGEDGVDDGGDPSLGLSTSTNFYWQNNRARDWVWPQPATDAEVKFFYEHPPK